MQTNLRLFGGFDRDAHVRDGRSQPQGATPFGPFLFRPSAGADLSANSDSGVAALSPTNKAAVIIFEIFELRPIFVSGITEGAHKFQTVSLRLCLDS